MFLNERLRARIFFAGCILSHLLLLIAIYEFYDDSLEELYIRFTLISLGLLGVSLRPALRRWSQSAATRGQAEKIPYLGLRDQFRLHHLLFLLSAVLLTGTPASFEFFLQEGVLIDVWSRSHLFLLLIIICLTLNTVNVFKLGQRAFLGRLAY